MANTKRKSAAMTLADCSRCGANKVAGTFCPHCGTKPRPTEINTALVARVEVLRKVSTRVEELNTPAGFPSQPLYRSAREFVPRLSEMLDDWEKSAERLTAARPGDADIEAAATVWLRLSSLENELLQLVPRRPFIVQLRLWQDIVARLRLVHEITFRAYVCPDLDEIRKLVASSQQQLDEVTAALQQATLLRDAAALLERGDNWENGFDNMLAALDLRYPGKTLVELDEEGCQEIQALSSLTVASGQGIAFLALTVLADVHLDPQNFRRVVTLSGGLLAGNEGPLITLSQDPKAVHDLRRAKENLLEAYLQLESVMARDISESQAVRQIVKLYHSLFEDGGLPIFAWMLLVSGQKQAAYSSLLLRGAGELAEALVKNPQLKGIFSGVSKNIRTAASHGLSYELVGEELVFANLKSVNGTMSVEDLLDTTLSFMESLLALMWALDNRLSQLGITSHQTDGFVMGLTPSKLAEVGLRHLGIQVVQTQVLASTWHVHVGSHASKHSPTNIAAGLALKALPGITQLVVHTTAGNTSRTLSVPVEAAHKFMAEAADAKEPRDHAVAALNLLRAIRVNGKSALQLDHLRQVTATIGTLAIKTSDTTAVPHLRKLLGLAEELDDAKLTLAIRQIMRVYRDPRVIKDVGLMAVLREWRLLPAVDLQNLG